MNIELADFTLRDDMSIIHWNFGAGWFSRMRNRGCQHRTAKYEFSITKNIYSIKRSGRTTVSVWGGMWLGGFTPLYRVMNNLTSAQYVTNVLEGVLLPYVEEVFRTGEPVTFVQDK
jgi:hypothetical protein